MDHIKVDDDDDGWAKLICKNTYIHVYDDNVKLDLQEEQKTPRINEAYYLHIKLISSKY